jgi:hypothetical protein
VRWLALLFLVGGCDALFRIDAVPNPRADAAPDGAIMPVDVLPEDAMADAMPQRLQGCPPSYSTINIELTKYRIVNPTVDWQTAASLCAADRGNYEKYTHLVVFDDDLERSRVNALVSGSIMWIGLVDIRVENAYEWVSSENPVYPPSFAWQNGAPDTTPGADCGEMLGNADLQMTGCSTLQRYICECDDFPNDPNHYTR